VPPQIATVVYAVGIAGLFWLDRDASVRTSKALWLPVIWLSIAGSRSPSLWLGMSPTPGPGQLPPTSLLDQFVAAALMLLAAIVIIQRRREVMSLLTANWPIVLYFSFCLVSLLWSDFPEWGFKRWVRSLGDLLMVLIVATDAQPAAAFRRLLSRVGFVLLPASVLLIKYYPQLGQGWDPWGTSTVYVGVATNKNMLGDLVLLIALGTLWQVLDLVRDRKRRKRARHLLAQCTLLAFGINLLLTAHSATSGASFALGAGLMLALSLPFIRRSPAAAHALVLALLLGGSLTALLGGWAAMTDAVGRNPDLTGRTDIWRIVISMAPNPIGGAGFETFWLGTRAEKVSSLVAGGHALNATNEAHDGYIEVYLNLGWLGVGLISLILLHGYRRAFRAFRSGSTLGALLFAYVFTMMIYNVAEAGFRMLSVPWFFLLLAVVVATRVITLAETASETGRELADPHRPPGQLGSPRTRPDLDGEDAVTRWSDRKEPRRTRIIVDIRKVDDQSRSRGC
jgi:exopolysaccharide production protein ExoQ